MNTNTECRVCLKEGGKIPIFGDHKKPDISFEVSIFGSIQLSKDDEFPKTLCKACFKLLENAISFRKSALHAAMVLQQRQSQKSLSAPYVTVKVEPVAKINAAHIPKPEFCQVKIPDDDDIKIKYECLSHDIALDDDENYFDTAESNRTVIDCDKKETKTTNYECTECSLNFMSIEEYDWHLTSAPHIKNCPKERKNKQKIKVEKLKLKPELKNIECNKCNKFYTASGYSKHMRVVHYHKEQRSKKRECPICLKMFRSDYLPVHKKKVHRIGIRESDIPPKVSVECEVCKKMISQRYLKYHMKNHDETVNKQFICDVCGKNFRIYSAFINHSLIHSNDLPYKCDHCPYRGRTKDLLRVHIRSHTREHPYKCTLCSYRGITKSNLNRHMLTHKGPVDFQCDTCKKGFYTKLEMERHIQVTHFGIKNHVCNICGSAFGYRKVLMKHERQVHKRAKMLGKPKATYLKIQEEMLQQ